MAQNAQSVVNVLSGGSDSSGGGFSLAGNTYGITDLAGTTANTNAPVVSSASYTFVAGDVGDYVYIASGTNWFPGLYPIASVAAGKATLGQPDPAVGTFSGCASVASPASGSASVMRIRRTAAFTNGTNLTVDGTTNTKVNPDGYTVTNADVGNWIQITTTGTGAAFTTGFYQITAVTTGASQRWTLDRSPAATSSVGATWAMGGAIATFSKASSAAVASNKVFFSGTFTTTATNTFAQNAGTPGTSIPPTRLIGYKTLWGDIYQSAPGTWVNNASRPTLTLQTNTGLSGVSTTGNGTWVDNLIVDCGGLGTSTGIKVGGVSQNRIKNCLVKNFTTAGISVGAATNVVEDCEAIAGTSAATAGINVTTGANTIQRCNVHDNACYGIKTAGSTQIIRNNLVINCSGASTDGIGISNVGEVTNNTVFNSGRDGMHNTNGGGTQLGPTNVRNNILARNGRYGIQGSTAAGIWAESGWDGNAYFSNATATRNNMDDGAAGTTPTQAVDAAAPYVNLLDVALFADPFVRATVPVADLAVDSVNNLKVTSGSYSFVASDVGATVYITNPTGGWNGPAEFTIASVTGGAAIMTASPGATSSGSGNWYFNNFRLNNTASAGASLRAAGTPGSFPGVSMLGFPDMGAAQSQAVTPPLIYGA